MHFDDQSFGARGDAGARHRRNQFASTGGMAGIDDDGKVGQFVKQWDTGEVEDVARLGVVAADAAFAEDDVRIARGYYVFGGQ